MKSPQLKRAVFTIATGKPIYLKMAFTLARSFRRWNGKSDITFFIATDAPPSAVPADLKDIGLIPISEQEYGKGFSTKLHLDKIAPAERSLFIDADCLCVRPLEDVFKTFKGRAVSVVGRMVRTGEFFGDIASRCARFGVPAIPLFNGGIYYLETGEKASRVFEAARRILPFYDEYGFVRLRGMPNEEPLISVGMAMEGEAPVPDRGTIMNSLLDAPGGLELDVWKGHAVLHYPEDHPRGPNAHELTEMRPAIVHLNDIDIRDHPYRAEALQLELIYEKRWWPIFAKLFVLSRHQLPSVILIWGKNLFRPLYRRLLGVRRIRPHPRMGG